MANFLVKIVAVTAADCKVSVSELTADTLPGLGGGRYRYNAIIVVTVTTCYCTPVGQCWRIISRKRENVM